MTRQKSKYLFTVSHFNGDPDRVATPLVLANSVLAGGTDVLVWLTAGGANLGRKGAAEALTPKSLPPVSDLLKAFSENGGRIGVCPPFGKTHGATDENMVTNGIWMGAAAVLDVAADRQVFSF